MQQQFARCIQFHTACCPIMYIRKSQNVKTFTITIAYMYIVTSRGPMHQESEKYWFGLKSDISNNVNNTFDFYWTGCEDSTFLKPLAPDFVPNETCVYMWVNREVFEGIYQEKWYYGQDCLSKTPFICSLHVPGESRIALFTCNKIKYTHGNKLGNSFSHWGKFEKINFTFFWRY